MVADKTKENNADIPRDNREKSKEDDFRIRKKLLSNKNSEREVHVDDAKDNGETVTKIVPPKEIVGNDVNR